MCHFVEVAISGGKDISWPFFDALDDQMPSSSKRTEQGDTASYDRAMIVTHPLIKCADSYQLVIGANPASSHFDADGALAAQLRSPTRQV